MSIKKLQKMAGYRLKPEVPPASKGAANRAAWAAAVQSGRQPDADRSTRDAMPPSSSW